MFFDSNILAKIRQAYSILGHSAKIWAKSQLLFSDCKEQFLGFGQIKYRLGQCSVVKTVSQLYLILDFEITLLSGAQEK